jgi:hypothetical protein
VPKQPTAPLAARLEAAAEQFTAASADSDMADLRALHYLLGCLQGMVGPGRPPTKGRLVEVVEHALQRAVEPVHAHPVAGDQSGGYPCGADGGRGSFLRADVTCPACVAMLATAAHAMMPDGTQQPRCGADGTVALFAYAVNCPTCVVLLIEQETDTRLRRTGIVHARNDNPGAIGMSVCDALTGPLTGLRDYVTCPDCRTRLGIDQLPGETHEPQLAESCAGVAGVAAEHDQAREVRISSPGSGVTVVYASQDERDRSLRLAEAHQQLEHEGIGHFSGPKWCWLTTQEQEIAAVDARNWLRAAERARSDMAIGARDRSLRLAEARQQLAHEGLSPAWDELTVQEQKASAREAHRWLRAAERVGLDLAGGAA